jgi:hypothetical protein
MSWPNIRTPAEKNKIMKTATYKITRNFGTDKVSKFVNEKTDNLLINYVYSFLLVISITLIFILLNPKIIHWFIIPAMFCGTLTGTDVIRWLRGSYDSFDPKGFIGLAIFYGWFIVPLLHAYLDVYQISIYKITFNSMAEFKDAMGIVLIINACGLFLYKICQRWSFNRVKNVGNRWKVIYGRVLPVLGILGLISFCAQIYFSFGIRGTIKAAGDIYEGSKGWGIFLMFGDALPILIFAAIIMWSGKPEKTRSWLPVIIFLAFAAILQFFWVGLRGSRSATVVGVFWAVGLVHHYWRKLKPGFLLLGLIILFIFLYLYGIFYKTTHHRKSLLEIQSLEDIQRQEKITGGVHGKYSILLGDLTRVGIQAEVAKSIMESKTNYKFRYGLTYLEASVRLIPSAVWKVILSGDLSFKDNWNKGKAYIDLTEGEGHYHPIYHHSSQAFGLSGEAMLNFGLIGAPLLWVLYGILVGWVRRKQVSLSSHDTRWVMMPLLTYVLISIPVADMDGIIFTLFKSGFLVFLATILWSRKLKIASGRNESVNFAS